MKIRILFFITLLLSGSIHFTDAQNLTIYVAPDGNPENTGELDSPLNSLESARDKIREFKAMNQLEDTVWVKIKAGMYRLSSTLEFLTEDSGTKNAPIVYEAEEDAIFSGGMQISGFQEIENGLWVAHVPEVPYWNWTFDQLYVNGRRAQRAKSPNKGYFFLEEVEEKVWVQGSGRSPQKAQQIVKINEAANSELSALSPEELESVIMTVYHHWNITKRHIDEFEGETGTIYTTGQGMKPWNPWKPGKRFILENYLEALDSPGEWYLHKGGKLYYMPHPEEKIEETKFIVPVIEQLIKITGDPVNDEYVEHITFKNLQFEHTAYNLPKEGFEPYQAAITIDAAIEMNGAQNIKLDNCQLKHTGGYGIWLNQGVQNCEINHCYLHDLGAGGIRIGETLIRNDSSLHTHSNRIENNIISSGGFEFPTAVGVLIGQSANNHIIHNDIADFRYTGVSVGWVWGYDYSPSKGNKILYNHIHHIGWGVLSDMAGVYTLGISEGTEVSNNHVHHIYAFSYGGWGLYTDEGSSHIMMENNLVHHTKTGGFHQHYGRENTIRNNIFAFSEMYQVQATRVEDHKSFSFTNNIVLYDKGVLFQGPWKKMQVEVDKNIYWKINGDIDFLGDTFKDWQKEGYDRHSFIEDPKFVDPFNGNFNFKKRHPYKKINFIPFNYNNYGVYGSDTWKKKAQLSPSVIEAFDNLFEN
jgi:hypothetical protein